MTKNLLIVESPSKAKTIEKYLGSSWRVLATFGHVRDLPSKSGSVEPENDFFMHYQLTLTSKKHVDAIANFILECDSDVNLFLATDPDREGEAIAWHVVECLKINRKIKLSKITIKRAVFNSITKDSIKAAIAEPRDLDISLINAQQSRLALDYLVGFTISPILWKTVGGLKSSAGRVQSVALRILVEREIEVINFHTQEYWSIHGNFKTSGIELNSNLTIFNKKKVDKFEFKNESETTAAKKIIEKSDSFTVKSIEKKQQQKNPYPPFTTSSLQQEASKRLGFNSKRTMSVAQKLYEGISIKGESIGLITYMRTDGIYITDEAISSARDFIKSRFGEEYLPKSKRLYTNKIKNAQEAHEAIRPTQLRSDFSPDFIKDFLTQEEFLLYQLIWKRTIASQMSSATYDITNILIINNSLDVEFKSSFSNLIFDGYLAIYEYNDDEELNSKKLDLSKLKVDVPAVLKEIVTKQHFTEPPARYSEAGLIKKMEEIGIGRPSTYSTIVSVLQTREYVRIVQKRFQATIKGHVITNFLVDYFPEYFAFDFTANMENELDGVANGDINWKVLLNKFWTGFYENTKQVTQTDVSQIMNRVSDDMMIYLFPKSENEGKIENSCPICLENERENGKLVMKFSRHGYFLGCNNYPICNFIRSLSDNLDENMNLNESEIGTENYIFQDHNTKVRLKTGRYGKYLEIEDNDKKRNVGITQEFLKDLNETNIKKLIQLPKFIGNHPEDGASITVNLGPYGFYIAHNKIFAPISKKLDPFMVNSTEALELLAQQEIKNIKNTKSINSKELGEIIIKKGGFGKTYWLNDAERIALPKNISFSEPDLESIEKFINAHKKKKTVKKRTNVKKQIIKEKNN